jgi:hypothetical protein
LASVEQFPADLNFGAPAPSLVLPKTDGSAPARRRRRRIHANTVPDQIALNKMPYYEALEAADTAASGGRVNVSQMEEISEIFWRNS